MDELGLQQVASRIEQKISDNSLQLPMLPQVTSEVLALVNDVDSDAVALSKLIQSDQALAGHVMRIANSAAYSPTAKMTSLQQAIARLGMQNISEIAMAASLGPKMVSAAGFESMITDLWRYSLAVAIWSREIARERRANVESAFLAGLLFQIGKPVVLQAALEISQGLDLECTPEEANQLMDSFGAAVGAKLAQLWQLPSAVHETITYIDSPSQSTAQDVVETVRAGKVLAAVTVSDRQYDADSLVKAPEIIDVNLYAADVMGLLEKTDKVHETLEALSL